LKFCNKASFNSKYFEIAMKNSLLGHGRDTLDQAQVCFQFITVFACFDYQQNQKLTKSPVLVIDLERVSEIMSGWNWTLGHTRLHGHRVQGGEIANRKQDARTVLYVL
jgi:hypothetical protein